MRSKRGVIYIATGDSCYAESLKSATSLRKYNPDLPITLFSERPDVDPIFDNSVLIEDPMFSMLDKVRNIAKTPYSETLFLDSDTFITGTLDDFFDVLEYCDFAGTIESARGWWYEGRMKIPRALCDINGGVLCFKDTPAVIETLGNWYAEYQKTEGWLKDFGPAKWFLTNDQPSLRKMIWTNRDIRVAILPDEFNALRLYGTRLWGDARVVHGRGDIERIADEMNAFVGQNRVFLQGGGTPRAIQNVSIWRALLQCLRMFTAIFYLKLRIFDSRIFKRLRAQK